MANEKRIGLGLFFNNSTNSGIVNYIYNIVAALNSLPVAEQPIVVLVHNETAPIEFIQSIGYKKLYCSLLTRSPSNFYLRKINSLLFKLTRQNYYVKLVVCKNFDSFYPYFPFINKLLKDHPNKIEWLVDFNNLAFPDYYDDKGTFMRSYQEDLVQKTSKIVLSSYTLLNELKKYYPDYKNDVRILRFACSLPNLDSAVVSVIKQKYGITEPYFMSPNQFWEHKNQSVVLDAIHTLKESNPSLKFKVLFTGSLEVNRGKGLYVEKLKHLIEQYKIEEYVHFLGVMERTDQLMLMRESIALIQPSLYEGWSTLVEEAKALNKFIILSDLPVHREQITQNVVFFNPIDANHLSVIMQQELTSPSALIAYDYSKDALSFGKKIVETLC